MAGEGHWRSRLALRRPALSPNVAGAVWMASASLVFIVMDVLIKRLGSSLPSAEIVFFRCFFAFLALLPFLARGGAARLRTKRPGIHVVRGVLGVISMWCSYYSLTAMTLADAVSISFTRPLFMLLLAVLFLGEQIRWRRWTATVAGFAGVVLIMRPGAEGIALPAAVALIGALVSADVVVWIKKLTATERPFTMLFYFSLISSIAAAIPAALVWQTPTQIEFVMLAAVGAVGSIGHFMSIRAYSAGEATAVMPFDYLRIVYAGLAGYLIFGEIPDLVGVVGAAIVVGSTLYIALREAKLGRRTVAPAPIEGTG